MTFAKTDGEDPTQLAGKAAVEGLLKSEAEALHNLGEKVAKVIVVGEKALSDEGGKVAKAVDQGEKTLRRYARQRAGRDGRAGDLYFAHLQPLRYPTAWV